MFEQLTTNVIRHSARSDQRTVTSPQDCADILKKPRLQIVVDFVMLKHNLRTNCYVAYDSAYSSTHRSMISLKVSESASLRRW